MRTPKYEVLLDEAERGVFVSHEDFPDDDRETLEAIEFGRHTTVVSRRRKYYFDLRSVRNSEMNQAAKVLRKMNFDGRFKLSIV